MENLDNGEIVCVDKSSLPKNIKEGNIVLKTDKYIIDHEFERKRREELQRKFDRIQ